MGSSRGPAPTSAAALALLALLAAAPARAEGLYLHSVPVRADHGIDGEEPLRLAVHVRRPEQLAARLPHAVVVAGDEVDLELSAGQTLSGVVAERYRQPSFVVDWDEAPVQALRATLLAERGAKPSLEALREFTGRAIPRKTMERGWDLASAVARSGAGDCTEHAVLLAALARSVGRPARVVVGVLLAESGEGVLAFGHAWSEIHDGNVWRLVDATPIGEQERVRHLPLFAIEDEGRGYGVALAVTAQATWVREIEVLGRR